MSQVAYQLAGPVQTLAANVTPATGDITISEVAGNLAGAKTPLFVKVTNTSSTVPVYFDAKTTSLSVATAGTVIGPLQTEFIQVLNPGQFSTVYLAASAASSVSVYVTPVTLV
jgi:hypothetical protein